ncbi:MAG: hypothetical protein C0493_10625 [Kytococcus sp.]|nr:hypothetical protein [Kytococcus sp.]HBO54402.1 hypothetical protein [Janibacter terrae]
MVPSILIIAPPRDVTAMAVAAVLRRRGVGRVELADDLHLARASTTHTPASGPCASDLEPEPPGYDVIWCRAVTFRARPFARSADAEYAAAEMHAAGLSWLWSRREVVVNRPSPGALCGTAPDLLRLAPACAAVGLATPDLLLAADAARVPGERWPGGQRRPWVEGGIPRHVDAPGRGPGRPVLAEPMVGSSEIPPGRRQVLVCGDVVDAPAGLVGPLRALVRSLDLEVASVLLSVPGPRPGGPEVLGVDPVPATTAPAGLQMLARHLEGRAAEHAGRRVA